MASQTVYFPADVHKWIEAQRKRSEQSFSHFLAMLIREEMKRRKGK